MKTKTKLASLIALAALSTASTSYGAALLIDFKDGGSPPVVGTTDWTSAGVTEDLSGAAIGTIISDGRSYHISNISGSFTGAPVGYTGSEFTNRMLNGYIYGKDSNPLITANIGGFVNGSGVANTITTSSDQFGAPYNGNSFTLQKNQQYKLYLFGAGGSDNQNTTFTFNGVSKTTNALITGTAANAGHFVTYDLSTGSDLTGFGISFTAKKEAGSPSEYYAMNSFALVAVPEPSSIALLGLGGLALIVRRRR